MDTAAQPPEKAPTIPVRRERLKCAAAASGALLVVSALAGLLSLLLPWWVWRGAFDNDFWGVKYKVDADISMLTACNTDRGGGEPSVGTCATVGSMIAFTIISIATSAVGAATCIVMVVRLYWLCGLLVGAMLAVASGIMEAIVLFVAVDMQENGLEGLGYYLAFGVIVLDGAAATMAIWGANKATPSKAEITKAARGSTAGQIPPRSERTAAVYEAAHDLADALNKHQQARRKKSNFVSGSGGSGERPVLQRVIDWGIGNNAGQPFPVDLLEAAFAETDVDRSGTITRDELAQALIDCGLSPSKQAMDRIMCEIDEDLSGDIDIHEFVSFFRMTEEIYDFGAGQEAKANLFAMMCSFGFFVNLISWALVGMTKPPADPRDAASLAEMWRILTICLVVMFLFNVALPMLKLTVAGSVESWFTVTFFHIQSFRNRHARKAAQAAREAQEAEEGDRRAAEWEARQAGGPSLDDALASGSPRGRSPAALGWVAGNGSDTARSNNSSSRPSALVPLPPAQGSVLRFRDEDDEDDDNDGTDKPGVYIVLHGGTGVRTGISITSKKYRELKRGVQVRIVEVFEYKKQGRVRGRLEAREGEPVGWISLFDLEDDYRWAERVGSLRQVRRSSLPQRASHMRMNSSTKSQCSASTPTPSSQGKSKHSGGSFKMGKRRSQVATEEDMGAPPYDPMAYAEAWDRVDNLPQEISFIGTSQVRDIRLYPGNNQEFPDQRDVKGGMVAARGEWKLGLTEK